MEAFTDKAIRKGFIKKVYCILTIQLAITVGIIAFYIYGIPIVECGFPPDSGSTNSTSFHDGFIHDYERGYEESDYDTWFVWLFH